MLPKARCSSIKLLFVAAMLLLYLLVIAATATADPEQYLTGGVDRFNTYDQDGTGIWINRAGVAYTRASSTIQSLMPLVGDTDGDGRNEIVVIENNELKFYNFTTGVGTVLEGSVAHGDTNIATSVYNITPALIDYDSDGTYEVVSTNMTSIMMFSYSEAGYVLNRTALTGISDSVAPTIIGKYPVIKCAPGNMWASNNYSCAVMLNNRSGANMMQVVVIYDIAANHAFTASDILGYSDTVLFHNTHVFDGDNDGFLEVYNENTDVANGDNYVYLNDVSAANVISRSTLYTHALANNRPFTDIIVTRLDGTTPTITWGYSSDDINYNAISIRANNGAVISSSYCTLLSCPEGNMVSRNMWVDDGTYGDYSGDVCFYLRNYNQNDPGINQDTIYCVSEYAGSGDAETVVDNSNKNFSTNPIIHEVPISGSQGLLTPAFVVSQDLKYDSPVLNGYHSCIPVDYELSGSLDIICMTSSSLVYYDDAYTNQNVQITSIAPDTGNPICLGETLTTTTAISDAESDAGNCYLRINYANGTEYVNTSSVGFVEGQPSVDLYFTGIVGNFVQYVSCKDQYHSVYVERPYSVTFNNYTCGSGLCCCKGYCAPLPFVFETNATAEAASAAAAAVDSDVETVLGALWGSPSSKLRLIVGIIIFLVITLYAAYITESGLATLAAAIGSLILVVALGLINIYMLIIAGLLMLLVIIIRSFVASNQESG